MYKPTSQEIIDKAEYLQPGFDPSSLLVAHLRAILQTHSVAFPANANKAQLVTLFNSHIAPNASKYARANQSTAEIRSDGSDILNADTGQYLEVREATQDKSKIS